MAGKRVGTITVALISNKGGVAKTSASAALALQLSERGRVLAADLDPQSSLTSRLAQDPENSDDDPRELPGTGEVLTQGISAADVIVGTQWPRLDLLPAGDLNGIDAHLSRTPGGVMALRKALKPIVESGVYDWIYLDTHPGQMESVQAAMVAASLIIAPAPVLSRDALDGAADTITLTNALNEAGLPAGAFAGIIATRHKPGTKSEAALTAVGEWAPILGNIRERAIWLDAETLRQSVLDLARPGTKQGDEIRTELATIIRNLKKTARKADK